MRTLPTGVPSRCFAVVVLLAAAGFFAGAPAVYPQEREPASVLIRGKGNKQRRCPLWAQTVSELAALVQGRSPPAHVFLNRCRQPITRFGIHTLVERYAARVAEKMPSVATKRVSPHTIRETLS